MTDQVRRSSRSIGAQIAEARAQRRYEKNFISKLTDADDEQEETQHWLETAADCGYLAPHDADELLSQCAEIGRLLGGVIANADLFCKPDATGARELQAPYLIGDQISITDD